MLMTVFNHVFNLITVSDFANGYPLDVGLIGKLKIVVYFDYAVVYCINVYK